MWSWLQQRAKDLIDAVSASVAVGVLFDMLPTVAAGLTIIWTGLRIYDWAEARWRGKRLPLE